MCPHFFLFGIFNIIGKPLGLVRHSSNNVSLPSLATRPIYQSQSWLLKCILTAPFHWFLWPQIEAAGGVKLLFSRVRIFATLILVLCSFEDYLILFSRMPRLCLVTAPLRMSVLPCSPTPFSYKTWMKCQQTFFVHTCLLKENSNFQGRIRLLFFILFLHDLLLHPTLNFFFVHVARGAL